MLFFKRKSKYITVGLGHSFEQDSYQAAHKAAEMAKAQLQGEPTFSVVYVDSRHDPEAVLRGMNELLGKSWVGCSTDRNLDSQNGYYTEKSIVILCFKTEYMHFGVGYIEEYRKNPQKAGHDAILDAMKRVRVDKQLDSFIQFNRTHTQSYGDIVRTPPYFIFTLISGIYFDKKKTPSFGREDEFVEGIVGAVSSGIPIFGAVSSSDFDALMKESRADNYQFADGKLLKHAGVCVFVVSDLRFSRGLEHGYQPTSISALIDEVKDGHVITKINGQPSVDEYCRIIGVQKEEFLKDPYRYTLSMSLAMTDIDGDTYIKALGITPDGKYLFSQKKLPPRMAVNVVKFEEKSVLRAFPTVLKKAIEKHGKNIAFMLVSSCSSRRALLGDKLHLITPEIKKKFSNVKFIGFYAFGEIGANANKPCYLNEQTITILTVFDELLTE